MKFTSLIMVVAFSIGVSACSASGDIRDQAITSAEAAAREQMKDPSSAVFSDEYVVYGPKDKDGYREVRTCGYVNGRNGFGAFSGKTRFIVLQVASNFQGNVDLTPSTVVVDDQVRNPDDTMQTFFDMQWTECDKGTRLLKGGKLI